MNNRLVGQMAIVAGVFIMLGGVCFGFGMSIMGLPIRGMFTLAVGFIMIVLGARMVGASKDSADDGE